MKLKEELVERFVSERFADTPVFFVLWDMLNRIDWLRAETEVVWEKMLEKGLDESEWMDYVWQWWKEVAEFLQPKNSWKWNAWDDEGEPIHSWRDSVGIMYERLVIYPIMEKLGMNEEELINLVNQKGEEWREEWERQQKKKRRFF